MGYFDFLPSVAYPNDEGGRTIVKDILVRGKILDILRDAAASADQVMPERRLGCVAGTLRRGQARQRRRR